MDAQVVKMAINRLMCGNTAHSCKSDYIKLAIKALEKQIPMKPKVMDKPLKNENFWWYCGTCGASRHTGSRSNYCSYCGQRVDWSEYVQNNYKNVSEDRIEHAKRIFPELEEGEEHGTA